MRCDEARELLSPYLDGELAPQQRMGVDAHLVECSDCTAELNDWNSISNLSAKLVDPVPPADLWERIDGANVTRPNQDRVSSTVNRRMSRKVWQVTVAALVLATVGLAFAIFSLPSDADHKIVNLDGFLAEFAENPDTAQKTLIAKYENRVVNVQEAASQLQYQPVAAGKLPEGVSVKSLRVFEMPCCRCLQTVCSVNDKQTVVIFEHADEHSFEFGRRPSMTCRCNGQKTRIVEFDGQMVAAWAKGKRHLTLVGARDLKQVVQFVERLE